MEQNNVYKKLAKVKTKIDAFAKTEINKFANFTYTHLSTILEQINKVCEENGLLFNIGSYVIDAEKSNLNVGIIYSVKAMLINLEKPEEIIEYYFDIPKDEAGAGTKMKQIQSVGSTITYGTRYIYGVVFSLQFEDDADSNNATKNKTRKKDDFGSPTHPFSRENIIEFGKHSKTGDGDNKKWMELTDSYLAAIEKKVTGGYLNFVKKEIAFRSNDKKLKKDKEESEPPEKQTLTHGEVDKKEEETTGRKQVKKQPEKKVENKTDDDLVPLDQRKETLEKIELMRKKGHMSPVSVNKWIEIAETLNDPIEFQRFYWVVATAELVCRAGDANKINKETKIAYFKVIKDPATKISDLEPIMADVNKVMENR